MDGFYTTGALVAELQDIKAAVRERIETRLKGEGISWDWVESSVDAASALVTCTALSDLLIVSQYPGPADADIRPLPIVGEMAVRASCATLVVPAQIHSMEMYSTVVIGWNGSPEAAHALRQARPFIAHAKRVDIVAVGKDEGEFSQEAASLYLAHHGIASELHIIPLTDGSIANTLHKFAVQREASVLVIGAYGHSRLREALMGGVTRDLLEGSKVSLLLAH